MRFDVIELAIRLVVTVWLIIWFPRARNRAPGFIAELIWVVVHTFTLTRETTLTNIYIATFVAPHQQEFAQ